MKLQLNHLRVYIFFTIVTRKSNFLNSIRLDYFLNSISESYWYGNENVIFKTILTGT